MSLVGLVAGLFDLAALAAAIVLAASYKGVLPINRYRAWVTLTSPLRAKHVVLPVLSALSGWFVLLLLSGALEARIANLVLLFVIPIFVALELYKTGVPLSIGVALGALSEFTDTPQPDRDNFALPIDVYESEADDVRAWTGGIHIPRRSLLTLGASGAGKSETIKHFVSQLRTNPNEPVVVFDMKTDYQDFLETRGVRMLRVAPDEDSNVRWNLFAEVEEESDIDEIARSLFPDRARDEFFGTAGRQLFAATAKYMYREMERPDNSDIVSYWERTDPETMHADLRGDGHKDLVAAASAIDPDAGRQASGVFATAQQQVSDYFSGTFASAGGFSIREYMEDPRGRVLVLDYPSREAESIAPLYRFMIDEAIKHGMDDPHRPAYFLLDEIEHLKGSPIKRLGDLINVGRGVNCQAILSLQSIAQLRDTYGRERANALLSGMTASIILRCADPASVEYARATIGTHFEEFTGHVERGPEGGVRSRETRLEEQHDFAEGDFYRFEPGEAVVCRQGKGWVHGRIKLLD